MSLNHVKNTRRNAMSFTIGSSKFNITHVKVEFINNRYIIGNDRFQRTTWQYNVYSGAPLNKVWIVHISAKILNILASNKSNKRTNKHSAKYPIIKHLLVDVFLVLYQYNCSFWSYYLMYCKTRKWCHVCPALNRYGS